MKSILVREEFVVQRTILGRSVTRVVKGKLLIQRTEQGIFVWVFL